MIASIRSGFLCGGVCAIAAGYTNQAVSFVAVGVLLLATYQALGELK